MYRIVVVEDHEITRKGIVSSLSASKEFQIVGEASNRTEAFHAVRTLDPDLIITDLKFKPGEGTSIDFIRQIKEEKRDVKIFVLTNYALDAYVKVLMEIGVHAYRLKEDTSEKQLVDTVKFVLQDQVVLSEKVRSQLFGERPTDRQINILYHIRDGESNNLIAERLHMAEGTVRKEVTDILNLLGVNTRVGAVVEAARRGWIEIDDDDSQKAIVEV